MYCVSEYIARFRRVQNERGWIGFIRHLIRNHFPIQRNLIYRRQDRFEESEMPGLEIVCYNRFEDIPADSLRSFSAYRGRAGIDEFHTLFSLGARVWLGYSEGDVAGACWSNEKKERNDYFVPLRETDAVIMSCFVFPNFRNRGIYAHMLRHMVNALVESGIRAVYMDCKSWNIASARGIGKADFELLGSRWQIALLGRKWSQKL